MVRRVVRVESGNTSAIGGLLGSVVAYRVLRRGQCCRPPTRRRMRVSSPGRFVRVDFEPGTRVGLLQSWVRELGQIVEDVSGIPFERYLRGCVSGPLGMESPAREFVERPRRIAACVRALLR